MKLFSINSVMQNAFLRKPLTLLCVLFSSLPVAVYAGGGEHYSSFYKENGFNILYDGLLDETRIVRSKRDTRLAYNGIDYDKQRDAEYNSIAWQRFLKKNADDIKAIVYRGELTADLSPEVSTYLRFVQLQQPLVDTGAEWRRETKEERAARKQREQDKANEAIATAQQQLQQAKTPFIRQRYVFLMVRLAHYSAQYDKALQLYGTYIDDINKLPNEVAQWIEALRAGALKRQGEWAQAAYIFVNVFNKSRTRKTIAHRDFRIKTDAQWDALMALCKNNDEKVLIHYMRALKINANSLQELQQVYQLAPNSVWINALLLRELEFVQFARDNNGAPQKQLLIDDVNRYNPIEKQITPQKIARRTAYLNELIQLVDTIKTDKKRQDLFLFDYAALYLRLLSQKPITVADVEAFQQRYANTKRTQYTKALAYFVYLENLETIDDPTERSISSYLEAIQQQVKESWQSQRDLMDYTYSKLAPLYVKTKQKGKAYIAQNRGNLDKDTILVGELRDLNALAQQKNPNLLTQQMTQSLKTMINGDQFTKALAVNELIARKYIAAGLIKQAKELLQDMPQEMLLQKTRYNPFTTSKSGNNRINSTSKNLLELTDTILTLQQQTATNPQDANAHFLLATAYYNMTWFGNSPMVVHYYRSTTHWKTGITDLSKAKQHYEQALQHANDRELKAKTLYALAKIEERELMLKNPKEQWPGYNAHSYYDYQEVAALKRQYGLGKYFKKIQAYQDTDYFNEVIKQCADYRFYSAN